MARARANEAAAAAGGGWQHAAVRGGYTFDDIARQAKAAQPQVRSWVTWQAARGAAWGLPGPRVRPEMHTRSQAGQLLKLGLRTAELRGTASPSGGTSCVCITAIVWLGKLCTAATPSST